MKFLKPNLDLQSSECELPEIGQDGLGSAVIVRNNDTHDSVEQQRRKLPVFAARLKLLYCLENYRVVIITGETGSGKSTQVPQYIYEAGWLQPGEALMAVTQPRRVAVISIASRIADERDWRISNKIGYSIRFERMITDQTVIQFFTDGMLIQEMLQDPLLSKYRVIMLDEVHERSLQTDILIGLLRKVLARRPFNLRLIISSATLETGLFFDYFSNVKFKTDQDTSILQNVVELSVEGRMFPVRTFYVNEPVPCYIKASLNAIFELHEKKPPGGDILVFLTGQEEIKELMSLVIEEYRKRKDDKVRLGGTYHPLRVVPFYGSLSQSEQMRAFHRNNRHCRKVVISTNLAEASVTIPGVIYVVDCGFSRIKAYNPDTGLETLVTMPVSRAAAKQRAGRAGRMMAGEAYRLYTEETYEKTLAEYNIPEISRSDLSCVLLRLKTLGIDNLATFPWLPPQPPMENIGSACERLVALDVLEPDRGHLNIPKGLQVAQVMSACGFSDPGAAVALLAAEQQHCTKQVAAILALMQIQHVFFTAPTGHVRTQDREKRMRFGCQEGDHLTNLNAFVNYEQKLCQSGSSSGSVENWCESCGLNGRGLAHAKLLLSRIQKICKNLKIAWLDVKPGETESIVKAMLQGYFTQVARIAPTKDHYLCVRGENPLRIHPTSVYYASCDALPEYIMFTRAFLLDSSDLPSTGQVLQNATWIGEISAIDQQWLIELVPHYYFYGTDREHLEEAVRSKELF